MAEHLYCGSGKEKEFENGGKLLTISLNMDDLEKYFSEYGFVTNAQKRIIKIKVGRRREVGQYGETHTVEVDTFKPSTEGHQQPQRQAVIEHYQNVNRQGATASGTARQEDCVPPDFPDDIPF